LKKIKVTIKGCGVIGKLVADSVSLQADMELTGICESTSIEQY
jgi:glyceraldehyde-3-phosphate dehydrogenase/erythrose-4-phosphate dehydrogenase